jgi:hypothetical protein
MDDESQWSSRYYRTDCSDVICTMKTDGPDDRIDPTGPEATMECIMKEHGKHAIIRISPNEWERLTTETDEDYLDDWRD